MKNLKTIIKKLLYRITYKKLLIQKECVFINQDSWSQFTPEKFNSCLKECDLQLVYGNPLMIQKKDCKKIVAYIGNVDKSMLHRMENLKWLQLASHGYNGYDDANLYGLSSPIVSKLKDVFCEPISEFCVAAYFYFYSYSLRSISVDGVDYKQLQQLPKCTSVIIMGLGNIGTVLAEKCKSLGWTVIGVKKHIKGFEKPECVDEIVSLDQLDTFLGKSNYVVNLLPESDETKGLYDYTFFEKMDRNAIFCNVGRGVTVNDADLDKAVSNGVIAGAILDASSTKKYNARNIIVTNHTSYISASNPSALDEYYTLQLLKFLSGNKVENTIPLK